MTHNQPGWYPDPQSSDQLRWHDGTQWTPHRTSRVALRTAPGAHPLTSSWFSLTRVVQVVLSVIALLDVWSVIESLRLRGMVTTWQTDVSDVDVAQAEDWARRSSVLGVGMLLALLACGVLFVIWLFQAHRSSDLDRTHMAHASGWAIGGWFVPVLNLWRPLQMVQDVYRGVTGGAGSSPLVVVWWVAFVAAQIAGRIASAAAPGEGLSHDELLSSLHDFAATMAVASVIDLAAAVVAVVMVQQLATRVRQGLESPVTGR